MPGREDRDRWAADRRAALALRTWSSSAMADDGRGSPGTPSDLAAEMRRRQFATLLRHSPDATVIVDGAGLICEWNPAAELMLSRQRATVVGRPINSLVPEVHRPQFDAAWAELAAGRGAPTSLARWMRPDGSSVTATTHVATIRAGGRFAGAVAIVREGSSLESTRALLVRGASGADARTDDSDNGAPEPRLGLLERDELTGLPGRRHLRRHLAAPIPPGLTRGVAVVDIDGFALVNEAYGPDAGDEALRDLARRLVAAAGTGYLGRWHADSFVWTTDAADPVPALDELSARVVAALDEPFVLGDDRLRLTVSTGLVTSALAPDLDLLAAAMDALRAAKESGRDRAVWYLPAHRATSTGAFRLANDLHRGIENDELRLHFQPIIELETNAVVGVEALVRWERPGVGLLGPMSFIEMAERSGLIVQLGAWVARHACAAAGELTSRADGPGKVSINLSARQLSDPGLVDMLRDACSVTGCAPSSIIVEVTETALTYDLGAATATLETIKELGMDLDLDDFGTGYSSLLYLRHFPVDRIKIDRSFIAGLGSNFADTAIVFSTIALAHSIGIHAVAEGVETPDQLAILREMGCDFAQGFLISRPVELDALTTWLDQRVPDRVEPRVAIGDDPGGAATTVRDRAATARDVRADSRDGVADIRDDVAAVRDHSGDERDDVGDARDEAADERDDLAAAREKTADERDKAADERENVEGASEPRPAAARTSTGTTTGTTTGTDIGTDGATARRRARSGRDRASADRGVEATERVQAEHRRDQARANRTSGASVRVQAERDRDTADAERNAPTPGRA
jgi:PAS domain S-box-containing protein/diguanylate cyclase (GGDEF)-like protein